MVDIARALGKQTVAEYVAGDKTLALVRSFGIDYAQGFHIGEPGELLRLHGHWQTGTDVRARTRKHK